jgi:hypothetical protein
VTTFLMIMLATYLAGWLTFVAYWSGVGFPILVTACVGLEWPCLLLERWTNRT